MKQINKKECQMTTSGKHIWYREYLTDATGRPDHFKRCLACDIYDYPLNEYDEEN